MTLAFSAIFGEATFDDGLNMEAIFRESHFKAVNDGVEDVVLR